MRVKIFLLKRLWDKISQTNFNERSHIHISFKMIQNMIKIILYVDSKLLDGFTIWPSINGTLLLDYIKNSSLVCTFNITEEEFSMYYGKYALTDKYIVDSGEFSLETIEQHLKNFKTEYE
jgi:hypothetical protein